MKSGGILFKHFLLTQNNPNEKKHFDIGNCHLICTTFFMSCDKDDEVSVAQALVGNWSLDKFSIDNGDGMLDSAEKNQAYDLGFEIGNVNFAADKSGTFTSPYAYYYPTLFGKGSFYWNNDDKAQTITITTNTGQVYVTKLIFQDLDHFTILEQNSSFTYGQPMWIFCERK